MNDPILPMNRRPIVIADDVLHTGKWSARVSPDDPEALLKEFLRLIRRARSTSRHRNVALRRSDIEALAEHLGWTEDRVLTRLADLMGSTRRQRATMLAVLATGASLITISQPAAAEHRAAEAGWPDDIPIVVEAPDDFYERVTTPGNEISAGDDDRGGTDSPTATSSGHKDTRISAAVADAHRRTAPGISGAAPIGVRPSEPVFQADPTAVPAVDEVVVETVAETPDVAETPSAATDADGNIVAVGEPPVPPATDADGNFVAVGEPPVPPATDADGNFAAVGEPPVPPATDD